MFSRLITTVLLVAAVGPAFAEDACTRLQGLTLSRATIESAKLLPEGSTSTPAAFGPLMSIPTPARCEVQAIARPSKDSEIRLLLWLPAANWNGKYLQVGNGGWAGSIDPSGLAEPLRRGYAVAATDDGHQSSGAVPAAQWAVGHPEKLVDFGHRAVHETSVQAKAILKAFYGRESARNYFMGCSDGGREALMEAQRYPEDFEGIVAGAPANDWSHLFTGFIWNERAMAENPIPAEKLPAIQNAVLAACDAQDGVKDGLIEDPRACRFDPRSMVCKANDTASCLTEGQASTLQKIYDGPRNPRTGKTIFPGSAKGTEAIPGGWSPWILPPGIQAFFGNSYYGQAVFEKETWDFRTLDFDADVEFGHAKAGAVLNATSPDLRSFRANGGKLIQYHGWGDAAISPLSSIEYFERVRDFMSRFPDARHGNADPVDFHRLFMVPGMAHCSGGIGATDFGNGRKFQRDDAEHNLLSAIEAWVERGTAPAQFIATGVAVNDASKVMTRPLCPYPQTARYKGTGDPNDARNSSCAAPAAPR